MAGSIPFTYAIISALSIIIFALTGRYGLFRFSQILLILVLPFLLMAVLGGFVNGSGVIIWALLSPLGALMFAGRRQARRWLIAYVGLLVVSGILEFLDRSPSNLPSFMVNVFFVMNIDLFVKTPRQPGARWG